MATRSEGGIRVAPPPIGIEAVDRVALPHASRIQAAFGRHSIGDVQAHVGPRASVHAKMLGASAFTSGSHVAFAGSPSLHTAAHEAAHVIQQRAGVGDEGAVHERHADEVADGVVAGRSVEGLLDHIPPGPSRASNQPVIQRKIAVTKEQLGFPDAEAAFTALSKSKSPLSLAQVCAGQYANVVRFYLLLLDAAGEPFFDFRNLEATVTAMLTHGTGGKSNAQIIELLRTKTPTGLFLEFGPQVGKPIFGTAVGQGDKKTIFKQALTAGYRSFDTAHSYGSLDALAQAIGESGLTLDDVELFYKVKPGGDVSVGDQLAKAKTDLGGVATPGVLMLHEMDNDMQVNKQALATLIAEVVARRAKKVGVSNVDRGQLELLQAYAKSLGVPISYVQNRFSPYHQDEQVRVYCKLEGIQYQAYGLTGSSMHGGCAGQGEGMPTQYLLARADPRLADIAKAKQKSVEDLVVAWAQTRGVTGIGYSSKLDNARKNFAATSLVLDGQTLAAIDALFATPVGVKNTGRQNLDKLYASVRDSTTWWLIDELCSAGAAAMLDAVAGQIIGQDGEGALSDFAYRIVQCAADYQSYAALFKEQQQVEIDWLAKMKTRFGEWAGNFADQRVADLVLDWARQNPTLGRDIKDTDDVMVSVGNRRYVPQVARSTTGKHNKGVIQPNETFSLFRAAAQFFMPAGATDAVKFDQLQVNGRYATSLKKDGLPAEIRIDAINLVQGEATATLIRWIPKEVQQQQQVAAEQQLRGLDMFRVFKLPMDRKDENHVDKQFLSAVDGKTWLCTAVDDMGKSWAARTFTFKRVN